MQNNPSLYGFLFGYGYVNRNIDIAVVAGGLNRSPFSVACYIFIILYFIILFAPLVVVNVPAFNDSMFTSLPWRGFTLDWFFGKGPEKIGLINDSRNIDGILTSFRVAFCVTILTSIIGTLGSLLLLHHL